MEPATILVLALTAGVLALLIWFEINSRRNAAREKHNRNCASSAQGLRKNPEKEVQPDAEDGKAA